jgi:hypothetical protein
MYILVPTVHHTGTKTVFNDILNGMEIINQQDPTPPPSGKLRIHLDGPLIPDVVTWLRKAHVIVPIRHPRKVALGWKARHKKFARLDPQWTYLKELVDPYKPFYLPLDRPDRNKWLREINFALGTDFTTNWPVLGQHCAEELPLDDKDEHWLQNWMADGFFDKFGYTLDGGIEENG